VVTQNISAIVSVVNRGLKPSVTPTAERSTIEPSKTTVKTSTAALSPGISYEAISNEWTKPSAGNLLTVLDSFSTNFQITFEMKLTVAGRIGTTAMHANILQFIPERAEDNFTGKQSNTETCVKAGRVPGLV